MAEGYEFIQLKLAGPVAWLTLARPPVNVLNIAMMEEVGRALDEAGATPGIGGLVIQAEGKAFCAGVDVGDHRGDKVAKMLAVFHGLFQKLADLPCATLAVVQGSALGGGCELAIACDLVIASEDATFGQPEIKVGVFPPVAAVLFPNLVGEKKAYELLLTGDTIGAREAEKLGLVNQVVPQDKLAEATEALIQKLRGFSSVVLMHTRRAIQEGRGLSWREGLARVEKRYLSQLMKTEDAQEGLKAFLEKRKPVWKGR
jgi:cyclohexa-1,5-dienecarbonyl-CoA hydratase